MNHSSRVSSAICFLATTVFLFSVCSTTLSQTDNLRQSRHQDGLKQSPPAVYLLTNGVIHTGPDQTIAGGSILIDRTRIVDVGADIDAPNGAIEIDLEGKHVYCGFVETRLEVDIHSHDHDDHHDGDGGNAHGAGYWNSNIQPERNVAEHFSPDELESDKLREQGFTTALLSPSGGIIRGSSSIVLLGTADNGLSILQNEFARHLTLTVRRQRGSTHDHDRPAYPNSPMGAYTLARQAMYDAAWYRDAWKVANANSSTGRPEYNVALDSLTPVLAGEIPVVIDASNELFAMRADRFAREFGLKLIINGSGLEYRRLEDIAGTDRAMIIPVDFPKPPDVSSPESAMEATLESLMHWELAPTNPRRLKDAGVSFAITSHESDDEFLDNLRTAVKNGLPEKDALAAITTAPAKLLGIEKQTGTIERGLLANLVIFDDDLFLDESSVIETWVAGERFEFDPAPLRDFAGTWTLQSDATDDDLKIEIAPDKRLTAKISAANDDDDSKPVKMSSPSIVGARFSGAFRSDDFELEGISRLTILLDDEAESSGWIVLPDGTRHGLTATRIATEDNDDEKQPEDDEPAAEKSPELIASVNFPLGAYGRDEQPEQPKTVLIKNATVWTSADGKPEDCIIENGAVLFGDGVIEAVFSDGEELPDADLVIDAEGKHVTPGVIDCHSHMATDSGVNESGQSITAEVRIGDMIDCDDINIYRQLAGGVTTSNILHGSSNPIGGQNQVIKLRWGLNQEEMKFADAPGGIKFALGENVKRSNGERSTRYPQTRMGVEQIMRDRLTAAKEYRQRRKQWEQTRRGLPPRTDLELEAIAEIVEGTRWIHCHSYRQDEILALIRLLDEFEITIGSFQHILEGYKVADQMAAHGATGSAFADWWAYKYEVIDAIPHAGALMHDAGVVVSFNSDDAELARHLNHEAAKAVRFGGVNEHEALKFVTLNPAKQLRIDEFTGSLEPGKHADIVIWSGHPLSNLSRCEQTWVDGRKYFDIADDEKAAETFSVMRHKLIQKILASGEEMVEPGDEKVDNATLWPRYDEFCAGHSHEDDGGFHEEGGE